MAAVNPPLWLKNVGTNDADALRRLTKMLRSSGVRASADLAVTQNGTPNMSVNVAAGEAIIAGTETVLSQGSYHVMNDAVVNLVIAAADPTNPRNDLIVAKVQDTQYSGAVNSWSLVVVQGTPAGSPADPAVPANSITLARVRVDALVTTIVTAKITDLRPFAGETLAGPLTLVGALSTAAQAVLGLFSPVANVLAFAVNSVEAARFLATQELQFAAASARIIGGSVALAFRNNGNTRDNLAITDAGHLVSGGAAPTLGALQTGISSQSISGTDSRIYATYTTTGAPPAANSLILNINYATAYGSQSCPVATGAGGPAPFPYFFIGGPSTTACPIYVIPAPAASQTYNLDVVVIG